MGNSTFVLVKGNTVLFSIQINDMFYFARLTKILLTRVAIIFSVPPALGTLSNVDVGANGRRRHNRGQSIL